MNLQPNAIESALETTNNLQPTRNESESRRSVSGRQWRPMDDNDGQ
jgi:hypothetical protein